MAMQIGLILCILLYDLLDVARHVNVSGEAMAGGARPPLSSDALEVLVLLTEASVMLGRHEGFQASLLENSSSGGRLQLDSRLAVLDDTSFGVEVAFEARVGRLLLRGRLVHL